jgi:hypothetical protein
MTYYEDFLTGEATVMCEQCGREVLMSDADETGERIGPDLIPYPTYICFACAESNDLVEEEL